MSLVNNYLKRLGRSRGSSAKSGVGETVPPSLLRLQKGTGRGGAVGRKLLGLAGVVVAASFLGYALVSFTSLLLYPGVDESIAVEVAEVAGGTQVDNEAVKVATGTKVDNGEEAAPDVVYPLQREKAVAAAAAADSEPEPGREGSKQTHSAAADRKVRQQPDPPSEIVDGGSGRIEKAIPDAMMQNNVVVSSSGSIEEPRPLTDGQIPPDDSAHGTGQIKQTRKVVIMEAKNSADYIYQLALQAQHSHNFGKAERYYQQLLKEKPDHENGLINLSAIYIQERRYEEARVLLGKVVAKNPENAKALVNAGVIELKLGEKQVAAGYFNQALKYDPAEKTALMNLAYLAQLDHRNDEAAGYFQRLVKIDPENRETLLAYAGIEEKRKEYASAMGLYRKCLQQMTMQDDPERYEAISSRIQVLKQYSRGGSF
jgi:tetratricopeptide (TPR) repeat protein